MRLIGLTVPHPSTLATSINWRGGVADLSDAIDEITDTGILDKKIVSESSNTVRVLYGSLNYGNSATITSTNTGVIFYIINATYNGVYIWRTDNLSMVAGNSGNASVSLSGNNLTITNNHGSNTMRYIAITN